MALKLTIIRNLIYYDGPVLFLGEDLLGVKYLCLLIEKYPDRDKYLCVSIPPKKLSCVLLGEEDLREVFENPEIPPYYLLDILDEQPDILQLTPIPDKQIDKAWFPQKETFLIRPPEQIASEKIIKDAVVQNAAIIRLSLSPPESILEHVISTPVLIKGLIIFQNIVRATYKRSIRGLSRELRTRLDTPENYTTQVYALSEGSFEVQLRAKSSINLFKKAEIERGLELLDEIVSLSDDPDKTIDILKKNRGHVANYFIKLLEFIIENNSPVSYSWAAPSTDKIKLRSISKVQALPIYEKAIEMKELAVEIIRLIGEFTKVDIEKNAWTIKSDEDERHFSGGIKEGSTVSIKGVTAGIQKYSFVIEERIEESEATGKEIYTYFLIEYRKITPKRR